MTERELLEAAARAAGLDGATYQGPEPWFEIRYGMSQAMYHESTGYWNPLEDDGDALRLAVKLKLTPHIDGNMTDCEDCTEAHLGDPYAATRRAITRAAASIGTHKEGA